MSYQKERELFIYRMTHPDVTGDNGRIDLDTINGVLRQVNTLQRLAVAQCNGDYPADNGQRPTAECESKTCGCYWAPESIKPCKALGHGRYCPDCRATIKLVDLLMGTAWMAVGSGDPRGAVVKLYRKDSTHDDRESGRAQYVAVPTRRY